MRTLTTIQGLPQVKWQPTACIQLGHCLLLLEKVETASICYVYNVCTLCIVLTVSDKQKPLIATYTKSLAFKCRIYFFLFNYQSSQNDVYK